MTSIEQLYAYYLSNPVICTDTRSITPNCIFFALKGENFDANTFAIQALAQGAAFAVIDNEEYNKHPSCIIVADVLTSLQELAKHHRSQLKIPVIGLTGSNGKTTSKELINAVLAEKLNTFATKGNLNNHIGVPLSILSITRGIEIAVIEMGANHQKEIEFLCGIAQPTHGIITNVGMAHLDGFGGFEGVKKGKAELYAFLKNNNGIAFVNNDNETLMEMAKTTVLNQVVYYGQNQENSISGSLKSSDPYIEVDWSNKTGNYTVTTQLTGSYNFENILAAICIGDFFELSPTQINNGLSHYKPTNNRSQITETKTNTVICDFYNANPSSMNAALNNIKTLSAKRKVAVLGDMFELGPESILQHEIIAKQANESCLDEIIFIGEDFYAFRDSLNGCFFKTPAEAIDFIKKHPIQDSLVLLKGSRGMKLEQLMGLL